MFPETGHICQACGADAAAADGTYHVDVDVRRNPTPWYRAPAASVAYEIFTRWAPLVTRRSIPADSIARARPRRWNSSSTLTGSTSPTFVAGSKWQGRTSTAPTRPSPPTVPVNQVTVKRLAGACQTV